MSDSIDHKKRYLRETSELHRAYGEFAVEFELMCLNMRMCISSALHRAGLTEQRLARVLVAGDTAGRLLAKLRSVVGEVYRDQPEVLDRVDVLMRHLQKLVERRNQIIHATWFIGWGSTEESDFTVADGGKDRMTKRGVEFDSFSYSSLDFAAITESVRGAREAVHRLLVCIAFDEEVSTQLTDERLEKMRLHS